jgi:hypothetical protein
MDIAPFLAGIAEVSLLILVVHYLCEPQEKINYLYKFTIGASGLILISVLDRTIEDYLYVYYHHRYSYVMGSAITLIYYLGSIIMTCIRDSFPEEVKE